MRKELIGAASALALMTGAAFAQGTSTTEPSSPTANPPAVAAPSAMDTAPMTGESANSALSTTGSTMDQASAEDLIGKDVMGSDGEKIGSVQDVILDPTSGSAEQVVISSGGFLGIGAKQIAVNYGQVKVQADADGDEDHLTVSRMTQADVEGMPEFEYNDTMTSFNKSGDTGATADQHGTTPGAAGISGANGGTTSGNTQ
ncbi:hypothetical protein N825_27530 [Skermanella stibiiresistens SB22]|uniref:PRC-barrel domain-containing protein n=1 Tax=Skermanella stibiiresistens SB22 TaxID=1385369 RepID=W9H9E3_9PROT|nr:PRC-barrel domain-containing protein [Skermanella stibiiresistens]EWY41302.1 hypothetical protein N825_27530 [Skermanella stibiiresistens SB22]